ncbi:glycine cleavage system aminomethyltransferase GcvT [Streptomyces spiralis]
MSKKTPLHRIHAELGASFTDFAGWSMPLSYTSELAEHHAVRTTAGIFDLTHMGEIQLSGPEVSRALDYALVGEPSKIAVGSARYSILVHENGGVLGDLVVLRLAEKRYCVVTHAGNTLVVLSCLRDRLDGYVATIKDMSSQWALIAVHGPKSSLIVGELAAIDLPALKYYGIERARLADHGVLLARTGYTGEDGFEIYCRPEAAVALWQAITAAGAQHGLAPCGLACRDTLRLEAGMPLHGRELTVRTTPFDAGLGRVVVFGKPGGFVGEAALAVRRDQGPVRVLVGLTSTGRQVPRTGCAVLEPATGEPIGEVTSGALSPTFGHPVAMAYLSTRRTEPGTEVLVDIQGIPQKAEVALLPFYRRQA